MITKNHPSAYATLFQKAQEVLTKHGGANYANIQISNIDDYFSVLKTLADIEAKSEAGQIEYIDPIFTMLPTTEETFNIDANSRKIAIPENFAKYGVGVQGDEIAEILYFSIDRYFDAMDLADMNIIVQWKHSTDNNIVETLSATYKKSLTLQSGKIVFGWPITSEMTERSGNIEFSIRFYRREGETLIYSFSTLPAIIKIQAGLDFTLNEDSERLAINRNSKIYDNLRNSKKYNTGYVIATPAFVSYYTLVDEVYTPMTTDTYDLPVTLVAKAEISKSVTDEYVSGSGLTYDWYDTTNPNVALQSSYVYKEDPKLSYNPNEIYYILNNGVYEVYYIAGDNNPFDDTYQGEPVTLYTRHSAFEPNAAGTYYAIAKNAYVGQGSSDKIVKSASWTVPGPIAPAFTYTPTEKEALLEDTNEISIIASTTDNGEINTQWYYDETNNISLATPIDEAINENYSPENEGYYFIKATNTKNNTTLDTFSDVIWVRHKASTPNILSISNAILGNAISVTVAAPTYSEKITYQWQQDTAEGGVNIEGAIGMSYTPNTTGSYRCVVTNHYKGTTANSTSSWASVTSS